MGEKPEYCPTRGGSFTAYEPQWKSVGEWQVVPWCKDEFGVPYPEATAGITETIGLMGKNQALAIAYAFAAVGDAQGGTIEVRAKAYRVHYDIKAKAMDDDAEPMP